MSGLLSDPESIKGRETFGKLSRSTAGAWACQDAPPVNTGERAVRESGRSSDGRALCDQEGKTALLHDVAVLVDDLSLLDDDAALAHRALHGGARAAVNGVAHVHGVQHFPLEAHEGHHGEWWLVHAPAEPRRQAEREELGDQSGWRRRLVADAGVETDVRLGDRHARRVEHAV